MKIKSLNESLPKGWKSYSSGNDNGIEFSDYSNPSENLIVSIERNPKRGITRIDLSTASSSKNYEIISKSPNTYDLDDSDILSAISRGINYLTSNISDILGQGELLSVIPSNKIRNAEDLIFASIR